ncbi:hypothetical protein Tco_1393339 [Tanacetum coccineum]
MEGTHNNHQSLLTGKTSGFERPRALVLQILWGVVNRAHIDYAERMWEEFTQSIHNFTEDKRNLAQQAQGKKKATIILILSIRFTKLIIFHLQRLHNFHPRPESPLHLPTEEPVLGNLKFSAKGTKREVFGMTIPNELINDVIRGADYYDAYLEKVAKHQQYLTGKEVSDPDSPAPKPEKKRKPVSESSEAPPLAKRAKAGKVVKKRTVKSSKGGDTAKGKTDTGKLQTAEGAGKGKEKVGEEQAAQVLLHLQTTKKKSPTEYDTESDEEMPSVVRSGAQDEGQAGPDLITDPSSQPQPEHMDEGFTAAAYPDVQENLKLTVDEQTMKTNSDTEAESMVSVTIQQDTSVFPPMTSPVIGPVPRPDSPNVHWPLPTTTTTTAQQPNLRTTKSTPNKINESVKEVVISSVKHAIRAPHVHASRSPYSDIKEIQLPTHVDKAQEETKKKSKQDSPKTPPGSPPSPPPPPLPPSGASGASGTTGASDSAQAPPLPPPSSSTHQGDQSTSTTAPSSSKTALQLNYSAWTMTDTRIKPSITTIPDDLYMDDETTADEQAYSSGDEVGRDHIPTFNMRHSPAYEIVKAFHPDVVHLQSYYIQPDFFFNKNLEYLRYGRKVGRPALSISKMKATYYPDVGLEQLVPDQF